MKTNGSTLLPLNYISYFDGSESEALGSYIVMTLYILVIGCVSEDIHVKVK
jgi:hypothetical protein